MIYVSTSPGAGSKRDPCRRTGTSTRAKRNWLPGTLGDISSLEAARSVDYLSVPNDLFRQTAYVVHDDGEARVRNSPGQKEDFPPGTLFDIRRARGTTRALDSVKPM